MGYTSMRASGTQGTSVNTRGRGNVKYVNRLVRLGVTVHAEVMYGPVVVSRLRAGNWRCRINGLPVKSG
jgi:hypothetical protein